jgi:hypothetical protein
MADTPGSGTPGTPAPAPAAAPAPAPAPSSAPADWLSGLTPEVKSLIEVKGYKTPNDLGTAYINAERAIGADKIVLPGKDAKPEEWDAYYAAAGWPKDKGADGYQFTKPGKVPEGFTYSEDSAKAFAKWAHDARLTPTQAQKVHDSYVAMQLDAWNTAVASRAEGQAGTLTALKTEWGTAFDTNVDLAKRAMAWAGGDELKAFVNGPEALGNNAPLIKAFAKIGKAMGETMADGMGAKPQGFAKSPEEAKAEIARIQGEAAGNPKHAMWDKLHPEHDALVQKLAALNAQAFPEPKAAA